MWYLRNAGTTEARQAHRPHPVAVEVNTADPATVNEKLRQRFGLERVVLVGDRGMLTEARMIHTG